MPPARSSGTSWREGWIRAPGAFDAVPEDPHASHEAVRRRGSDGPGLAPLARPAPHPSAWLCADFRSTARDRPAAPWMLRLGVEAGTSDQVPAAQARVTAHDLAMTILDALTCTAVQQALRQAGEEDLAACLRPRSRTRDGLRKVPDAHGLGEWRANAARPGAAARHPVLFQDNLDDGGYRLASLIDVDVASLDRHQLTRLMLAALGHVQAKVLHECGRTGGRGRHAGGQWRLEPQLPADAQPVALAVPAGSRIRVWLLAADIGGGCRGHDRVQQPQNSREQLFHELARVNCNSSADTWLGTPGSPSAQVVHAGEDLALMLGWQRDRRVPDLAVLPHGGLDGLPVHGVPQSAQDRQHVRQRGAAAEEISQGLALAGEPGSPASPSASRRHADRPGLRAGRG